MRDFLIALQFLTVIPTKVEGTLKEDDITRSMAYFPLVGAILGVILVLVNLIGSMFPAALAKALVLITLIVFTGALPLRKFTVAAAALIRGGDSKEILIAMREERYLNFRTILCLTSMVLIKLVLLYTLTEKVEIFKTLFLMPVIGCWAMAVMGTFTAPSVLGNRMDIEVSSSLVDKDNYRSLLRASVIVFIISLATFKFFVLPLMAVVYLLVLGIRWLARKKVGEIPSEFMGVANETAETVTLLLVNLIG